MPLLPPNSPFHLYFFKERLLKRSQVKKTSNKGVEPPQLNNDVSYFRWWIAYRDAMSFRASHYFVSYISEASAVMAGLGGSMANFNIQVAQPLEIEFPRSLSEIVKAWNIPMHKWLKTCKLQIIVIVVGIGFQLNFHLFFIAFRLFQDNDKIRLPFLHPDDLFSQHYATRPKFPDRSCSSLPGILFVHRAQTTGKTSGHF